MRLQKYWTKKYTLTHNKPSILQAALEFPPKPRDICIYTPGMIISVTVTSDPAWADRWYIHWSVTDYKCATSWTTSSSHAPQTHSCSWLIAYTQPEDCQSLVSVYTSDEYLPLDAFYKLFCSFGIEPMALVLRAHCNKQDKPDIQLCYYLFSPQWLTILTHFPKNTTKYKKKKRYNNIFCYFSWCICAHTHPKQREK